jgi:hypothetical protein
VLKQMSIAKGTRMQRRRLRNFCHCVDNNNTSETVLGIFLKVLLIL